MPTVSADIIDLVTQFDGPDGAETTRMFHVTGLDTGRSGSSRIDDAFNQPGLPNRLEAHPTLLGLVVSDRSGTIAPSDPSTVIVTINYRRANMVGLTQQVGSGHAAEVTVQATLQNFEDNFYVTKTGSLQIITTQHEFTISRDSNVPTPRIGDSFRGGQVIAVEGRKVKCRQTGAFELQVPMLVKRFHRRERLNPEPATRDFVGTINSRPIFGDAKHFWLCTRLDGTTSDGGLTYDVIYEFQRHPRTWDVTIIYIDGDTGAPVLNPVPFSPGGVEGGEATEGGVALFQVYFETDFSVLDLATRPSGSFGALVFP